MPWREGEGGEEGRGEETEPVLWKNEPRLQTLKTHNLCLPSVAPTTQKFRWLYSGESFHCLKNSKVPLLFRKSVRIKTEVQHHWDYHQSNPKGPWLKPPYGPQTGTGWVGGRLSESDRGRNRTHPCSFYASSTNCSMSLASVESSRPSPDS